MYEFKVKIYVNILVWFFLEYCKGLNDRNENDILENLVI